MCVLEKSKIFFPSNCELDYLVVQGFDERHAYMGGMFGAGIYFAEHSSKSNQYGWGVGGGSGCPSHRDRSCFLCTRSLLLSRVTLAASTNSLGQSHLRGFHLTLDLALS